MRGGRFYNLEPRRFRPRVNVSPLTAGRVAAATGVLRGAVIDIAQDGSCLDFLLTTG